MSLMRSTTTPYRTQGFTLLEVLVALVILSLGLLGVAGLLITSQKANSSSYIKQQSIQAAYDILDRMRANTNQAYTGKYNVNNLASGSLPSAPSSCISNVCSASQMASYDTYNWLLELSQLLPSGRGSITTQAIGGSPTQVAATITVQWDDKAASTLSSGSGGTGLCTGVSGTSEIRCQWVTQL